MKPHIIQMDYDLKDPWTVIPATLSGTITFLNISDPSLLFTLDISILAFTQLMYQSMGALVMAFFCGLSGALAKYCFDKILKAKLDVLKNKLFTPKNKKQ